MANNPNDWTDLDPSQITGEICMQCGRCCKTTWRQPYDEKKEDYLNAMFELSPRSFVKRDGNQICVENWCSNLMPDLKCRIYENRPEICSKYNCFEMANSMKRLPEYYDFIMDLIRKRDDRKNQSS